MSSVSTHSMKDLGMFDKAGAALFNVRVFYALKLQSCSSFHLMKSRYFRDVNKLPCILPWRKNGWCLSLISKDKGESSTVQILKTAECLTFI